MFCLYNKVKNTVARFTDVYEDGGGYIELEDDGDFFYVMPTRDVLDKVLEVYERQGEITYFKNYIDGHFLPVIAKGFLDGYEVKELQVKL